MKKYSLLFTIAYFVLAYIFGEVAVGTSYPTVVSLNVAASLVAAFLAAVWFGMREACRPTSQETNAFSFQALFGVVFSLVILISYVFPIHLSGAEWTVLFTVAGLFVLGLGGMVAAAMCVLFYFLIRLSFSLFTKIFHAA